MNRIMNGSCSRELWLEHLFARNFRMFEQIEVDFSNSVTLFVGDNGSGKSSILEMVRIAIGTFVSKLSVNNSSSISTSDVRYEAYRYNNSAVRSERQYPTEIEAQAIYRGEAIHWHRSLNGEGRKTTWGGASDVLRLTDLWKNRVQDGDASLVLPFFAFYGTNRLWKPKYKSPKDKLKRMGRLAGYDGCLNAYINYESMSIWFKQQALHEFQTLERSSEFRFVKEVLVQALQQMTDYMDISITYDGYQDDICISYIDKEELRYDKLSQMSDGFREVLVMLADIAYRMTLLNPNLEGDVFRITPGILLIDEVDLHLHPKWQECIIDILTKTFPSLQVIATTHAPKVVASVGNESVRVLENGESKSVHIQTYGKDVGSVLTAFMDARERPKAVADIFDELYKALEDEDINKSRKLIEHLRETIGDDDSDLAAAKTSLFLFEVESDCD